MDAKLMLPLSLPMLLLLLLLAMAHPGAGMYTTKYDNVDIESVIRNERLLAGYVGCLLETKPCTPDAAELKRNLPDGLATNCSGCSQAQKKISDRLSHYLIDHRPDDWSLLEQKYDPTGHYRELYLGKAKAAAAAAAAAAE